MPDTNTAIALGNAPRVISLARVSTEGQAAEGRAGLERQREVIRRTIKAKNLNCVAHEELIDVSGTVVASHPVIKGIFRAILDGTISGVVVADLDRLFRPDEPQSFAVLQVFKDMGAKIYSGDGEYDLGTKDGLLFSSIRGAIAGFELGLIKERLQGAKEAKRKAGKCPSGPQTLPMGVGYDRKTEKWHYTPEIGRVVELFRLFDQEGVHNYCELGRRTGIHHATVRCLLRNPLYTGWRVIDNKRGAKRVSRTGKNYRSKVARAPEELIRTKVLEGVVTEECFARVQAEMSRTKFNHIGRLQTCVSANLGAGLLLCAHCGGPMFYISGKRQGNRRHGWVQCKANHYIYKKKLGGCPQCHLRSDHTDEAITRLATEVLRTPKHLERIIRASLAKARSTVIPIIPPVSQNEQATELSRRDTRLIKAYEEGLLTLEEFRMRREAIRKEGETLSRSFTVSKPPSEDGLGKLARLVVKAAMRFPRTKDPMTRKKIVAEIFAQILVRDDQIIGFRFCAALLGDVQMPDGSTIMLSPALPIGPQAEHLPEGTKRCIRCGELKSSSDFYRKLNRCHPCRKIEERERHLRRKKRAEGCS
jgi:DNA invertase Pin-like site-specific DNA recombinase